MKSARPLKTGLIIFFIIIIVSLLFGFTYILVFSTDKKDVRVIKEDDKIVALNPFPKDYSDVKPKIKTIINEAEKEKNKSQQPLHQPIDLKPGKPNLSSEKIIREPENKVLIERQNALERGRIAPIKSKSFKAQGDNSSNKSLLTTSLTKPGTKFMIQAGSMLSANLITGINSDLPGYVVAKVNRDVFDSITGKYLLIPKGSKLIGKYSSSVKLLQKRVPVNWFNIKLPNGSSIDFKQGQPGTY